MQIIRLQGMASGRIRELTYTEEDLKQNLLDWLRSKDITMASSCDGEGVCKKCVIQNDWLTCMMTLEEFLQRQPDHMIKVYYL